MFVKLIIVLMAFPICAVVFGFLVSLATTPVRALLPQSEAVAITFEVASHAVGIVAAVVVCRMNWPRTKPSTVGDRSQV